MTGHKKILVMPDATDEFLSRIAQQIHTMGAGDTLVMKRLPVIIDIEDVRTLSKKDIIEWCKVHNMELKK